MPLKLMKSICVIREPPAQYLRSLGYDGKQLGSQLSPYLKMEEIFEEVKSADGRGHALAGYDGHENEVSFEDETYYIYRIN